MFGQSGNVTPDWYTSFVFYVHKKLKQLFRDCAGECR